jgi:ABC-type transporter Mla MlaB component
MTTRTRHFAVAAAPAPGRLLVKATGRMVVGHGADSGRWRVCLLPQVGDVLVDLSAVTALDARGVGVLASLVRGVTGRGRRFRVVAASPRAERVLAVTGLASIVASTRHSSRRSPAAA